MCAGICSLLIFLSTRFFILRANNSFERGIRFLPILYGVTVGLVAAFIVYKVSLSPSSLLFPPLSFLFLFLPSTSILSLFFSPPPFHACFSSFSFPRSHFPLPCSSLLPLSLSLSMHGTSLLLLSCIFNNVSFPSLFPSLFPLWFHLCLLYHTLELIGKIMLCVYLGITRC